MLVTLTGEVLFPPHSSSCECDDEWFCLQGLTSKFGLFCAGDADQTQTSAFDLRHQHRFNMSASLTGSFGNRSSLTPDAWAGDTGQEL